MTCIRDQYKRDIENPAEKKDEVNSIRSVERNKALSKSTTRHYTLLATSFWKQHELKTLTIFSGSVTSSQSCAFFRALFLRDRRAFKMHSIEKKT